MPDLGIPLITDPGFWLVAVPAVLITGLAKSGFLGGFGPLATPLLALAMPVPQAAAVMLPILLLQDATGIQRLWRHHDRELLKLILPAGLAGTVVGLLLFGVLTGKSVAALVGALTLLFVLQRLLFPPRADGAPPRRWIGRLCAAMAGFTSFVVHAGSPPMNAYLLPLRMPPLVYSGTIAVFIAGLNLSKIGPYAWLGLLDLRNLLTSLVLVPLAPLGVWLGVWLVQRIDPRRFYAIAYAGMAATGCKLLWDGLA